MLILSLIDTPILPRSAIEALISKDKIIYKGDYYLLDLDLYLDHDTLNLLIPFIEWMEIDPDPFEWSLEAALEDYELEKTTWDYFLQLLNQR